MTDRRPNIGLIGLGGIGGAYVAQAQDHGYSILVLCDSTRKARYEAATFTVNGMPYRFGFADQPSPEAPLDLILVAVKSHQLPGAIDTMRPFLTDQTIVISLLNGISSEEVLRTSLPCANVVHAIVVATDGQKTGYELRYSSKGKIVMGVLPTHGADLLNRTVEILQHTGIHFETPPDIQREQWWKFMINVGINHTAAILRAPYRHFQTEGPAREIARAGMREVLRLANYRGIALTEEDMERIFVILGKLSGDNKVSMLQDVEAGRTTEVEVLAGEVIRMGKELGINTPVSEFYYHAVRHLEMNYE